MKKKVLIFVCVALLMLTVVPVINIKQGNVQKKVGEEWWSRSVLYNVDFALPYLSRFFYTLGISIKSIQVIIGKDDWLYLGDQYANTITGSRRGANFKDVKAARKIGLATKSWEQWLKLKGVSLYRVVIGPNKSTIYPEFLPEWVQPTIVSVTDILLTNVSPGLYIDTRPALVAAKSQYSEPLYYKTYTHWNNLGAWVAFRTLAMELARNEVGLRWFSEQQISVSKVNERSGGDLAKFLWMKEILRDREVSIDIASEHPIETEQYDFETGRLTFSGGNSRIDAPKHPLLVKSKHALNQRRVLWLRDSFGEAMSPFMAATFTETLQIHYGETDPVRFAQLVDTYKPDYVFITVVEREALGGWFENLPPSIFSSGK